MQSLQDLQDKLFFECKNILDNVSKINTPEELLVKHDILLELTDRISILKYLEKNKEVFTSNIVVDPVSSIAELSVTELDHDDLIEEIANSEVEEEVLFTNELNEFDEGELEASALNDLNEDDIPEEIENQLVDDLVAEETEDEEIYVEEEPYFSEEIIDEPSLAIEDENTEIPELLEDELVDDIIEEEIILHHFDREEDQEDNLEEISNTAELDVETNEDAQITEEEIYLPEFEQPKEVDKMFAFAMDNTSQDKPNVSNESLNRKEETNPSFTQEPAPSLKIEETVEEKISLQEKAEQNSEKKFKLSNIKGVKAIQSLFDDEMFETPTPSISTPSAPIVEKAKNDFKLDLNDKIAFTKTLFAGSQAHLNDAIRIINDCDNLEEAKEYLSDLYYDRNWSKVDDYAQRLWTLVENKFG